MHSTIELLLQVQTLEQRLKELDGEIAALPRRIGALESRLATHHQALERSRAASVSHQVERKQVDRQIEILRARIDKSRSHSSEVKTNQEFKALKDEIAFAEGEINKQEERALQMMAEGEKLETAIADAEAALAAARQELDSERKQLESQVEGWKQEKRRLLEQRKKFRQQIDEMVLRRFDRVFRLRGQGVAVIEGDVCGSCRVRLRPQYLQDISNGEAGKFICESCSRILYFPEVDAVAADSSGK